MRPWAGMGLSGQNEEVGVRASLGIKSPERVDFLQGSSLELSSPNSSRGTYKWDEEGLEPLGRSTHPCESYDYSNHLNNIVSQRLVCPKTMNTSLAHRPEEGCKTCRIIAGLGIPEGLVPSPALSGTDI
ncbi:serine-rich coiled-coil domain-containing protein 2-like [Salmo trutta]|uniref:serine-rich coiled-coil domain-containing protein 2-like n=1 Tax=Salmo trutta TaxID=8032 RepID=UPI00113129C4|nr:serine-rich coiled-coil domain-containing protein 2-like [Salmo trutta]